MPKSESWRLTKVRTSILASFNLTKNIEISNYCTHLIKVSYHNNPKRPKKGRVSPIRHLYQNKIHPVFSHAWLVGGFNPFEKYLSKWESSPNRGENKKYLKPPPSWIYIPPSWRKNPKFTWSNLNRDRGCIPYVTCTFFKVGPYDRYRWRYGVPINGLDLHGFHWGYLDKLS